ncbi:dehydrogenase [Fomitiporia mediterranea MF3/22]|uniref:dehydrogenase n=1 Tax=Fomitiporia mediterranea (strain MF3/22) TaxID=694068 RepID=UPI0004409AB4|nr:dehydrogenase [Fomitiporia mediterranea MF3/22]EJD00001.1 dehydrogenase [Fomitiporia mediterranea MF3/22]
MAPMKMTAAVTCGAGGKVEIREIDTPGAKLGPTEALVKVVAAASNPTDWKSVTFVPTTGNVVGCDFAGIIEELGSEIPLDSHKVGDRVAGIVHGAAYPNGAFAEYVVTPAALLLPLPDSWSFEQAAQLGIAGYTACLALYYAQSLPSPIHPAEEPIDILVWGGSSSVGQYVVQLAHLSGLRVIATSSPRNFPLLQSLGADLVFSYADPEVPEQIRGATSGKLAHAVDCISEGETPSQVIQAMGDQGGVLTTLLPYKSSRLNVETNLILGYHLLGKDTEIPIQMPLDIAQYEFGPQATEILTTVLSNGKLKPGPIKVMPKGLESANDGLDYMREGKVSGEKIIYRIADTPVQKEQQKSQIFEWVMWLFRIFNY